jgi:hypothetical protein
MHLSPAQRIFSPDPGGEPGQRGAAAIRRLQSRLHWLSDRGAWRDETWTALVRGFDVYLRRYYGVYEFTADPACVLRVHIEHAQSAVMLSDGTCVGTGEPVGVLHLWNEHLPRFPSGKPDLHWAKTMRNCLRASFAALASHVADEPAWRDVQALRCAAAFSGVLRAGQMRRVAGAFGFEVVSPEISALRRAHALGEDFLLWGFARAFNPATLQQQHFFRPRRDLWISREVLLRQHRRTQCRKGGGEAARVTA